MMSHLNRLWGVVVTVFLLQGLLALQPLAAQESVQIMLGAEAPAIEQLAARELTGVLKRLFKIDATVVTSWPAEPASVMVLGSPRTNPVIARSLGADAKLGTQGQLIQATRIENRDVLLIAGGSPPATLWAVSELAHHWGERSLLFGDLQPIQSPARNWAELQLLSAPRLAVRSWTLLDDSLLGTESWDRAALRELLKQLAKQKYNRVELAVQPTHPFVRMQLDGVTKSSALLLRGETFSITGETAGRNAFRGAARFENSELASFMGAAERIEGGINHLRAVMTDARQFGLRPALCFAPTSLPMEYQAIAGGILRHLDSQPPRLVMPLDTDSETARQTLLKLAEQQLLAYLDCYPDLNLIGLSSRDASSLFEGTDLVQMQARLAAWGWDPAQPRFQQVWQDATAVAAGDQPAELRRQVGTLLFLAFVEKLVQQPEVKARLESQRVQLYLTDLPVSLATRIAEVVDPKIDLVFSANPGETPEKFPARGMLRVALTSSGPNILPLSNLPELAKTVDTLLAVPAKGICVEGTTISDLDLASYYVSRVVGGDALTVEKVYDQLLTPGCGDGVADRVARAMRSAEQAQGVLKQQLAPVGSPDGTMFDVPAESPEKVKEALTAAQGHYLAAMNEMYRANTRAREGGRDFTLYFARRFEFAFEMMNGAIALQASRQAKAGGDEDTATAELEKAIESLYGGLNALAAVAHNASDRAIIAVVNHFGFQPLTNEEAP